MAISPPRQPRATPKIDSRISVRPDPSSPPMPRISPGRTSKLTPSSTRRQPRLLTLSRREIAHRENGRAGAGHGIPAGERHLSPDHRGNDRALRKALDRSGQHALAVAQHRHAIGERDDFVQAVRRVDDRNARLRQLPHDLEQGLAFRARERGRRLVHDQDPRVQRQRLGDFDQLLFADPELRDATLRVDLDAEPLQERARGLHDAPVVDEGPKDQRLAAKEDFSAAVNSGTRLNSWWMIATPARSAS